MRLSFWQQDFRPDWIRGALCAVVLLAICVTGVVRMQAQDSAPLSKDDVLKLLQSGIPPKRVATLAREHKIDFPMDESTASQLREAGATEALITTLKGIAPAPVATVLLIHSRPGGAQVYIDDELIGTTSSEGKLKLSTLAAGQHRVRVSAEGYQDYDHDVDVPRGELTEVDASLQVRNSATQNDNVVVPDNGQSVQPMPTPQRTLQVTPNGSPAMVYFFRPDNFNGNLIAPNIYCDGASLGKLPNARYFSVPFPPGKHVFNSTNKKSRVELDLVSGNSYYIMVYMVMGFPAKGAVSLVPSENAAGQIGSLSPCGTNTDINGQIVSGCGH